MAKFRFRVTSTCIAVALLGVVALYFGFVIRPSLYEILIAPRLSAPASVYIQTPAR